MTQRIQAIRGMDDVLPEAAPLWERLEDVCRAVFRQYGYRNLRTPIVESTAFTAYDDMQSHLVDVPINPTGAIANQTPDATAGVGLLEALPLQFAVVGGHGSVSRYFAAGPVERTVTAPEFMAQRGIEFDQFPMDSGTTDGATSFASGILKTLGDRAIAVPLGTTVAALTWADPESNGVRTHNLYWADAQSNFALIADRPAAELVAIAQSIVCP